MKKIISTLFLAGILVAPVAGYAQKIGYVNSSILLSEYAEATGIEKKLEAKFSGPKQKLDDMALDIKSLEKEIKTNELLMTESKLLSSKTKLSKMFVQYKKRAMGLDKELNTIRKIEMNEFNKVLNAVVKKYAVDKKYDLILKDGGIFVNDNVNITDEISSLIAKAVK